MKKHKRICIIIILILAQLLMLAACSRTKEPREIDALTEYSLADLQQTFVYKNVLNAQPCLKRENA